MKFAHFSNLTDLMQAFPDEATCIAYLERLRWDGDVVSPFDPSSKVYKCKNGYKCANTNKYFNVRTDTIFQDTKLPLRKWIMAMYIFFTHKKGISSHQLARDMGITQKTAWFVLHRLRFAMKQKTIFSIPLNGTVESDEVYIGRNPKNKHQQNKSEHIGKKTRDKSVVLGIVERGNRLVMKHIPYAAKDTIVPIITENVWAGTRVFTDEHHAYRTLTNEGYVHLSVQHGEKEFVRGIVHTNTIEGVWSILKRGIYGTYHFTSRKHLQAYLDEFSFRYNVRKQVEYNKVNEGIISSTKGRLTYAQLIQSKGLTSEASWVR